MQEVVDAIKELGFPVVVACFVLFRMNGKFDKLRESIDKLIHTLEKQHKDLEDK